MTSADWAILAIGVWGWLSSIFCFVWGARFGRESTVRRMADDLAQELEELP